MQTFRLIGIYTGRVCLYDAVIGAVRSFKTSLNLYQTTRRHVPEYSLVTCLYLRRYPSLDCFRAARAYN